MHVTLEKNTTVKGGKHTYIIKEVLGQGGFGITYMALVKERGNVYIYALKEHFIQDRCERNEEGEVTWSKPVTDYVESSKKDFLNEAHRLEQLREKNENIVRVEEAFEYNNTAYFAMEYLDGDSLAKKVQRGVMDEREMLRVMRPVVLAVQYLHDNRLLHLDIKPENIVMRIGDDGKETPVLIDFGVSMHFNAQGGPTTTSRYVGGTKGYAPLEQAWGVDRFAPTLDVYALGATMYYLLTGKEPGLADHDTAKKVEEQLKANGVSETTVNAISHAMRANPAERTSSALLLMEELSRTPTVPKENDETSTRIHRENRGNDTVPIKKEKDIIKKPSPWWKKLSWLMVCVLSGLIVGVLLWPTDGVKKHKLAEGKDVDVAIEEGLMMKMVWVEGGTYEIGATEEQGDDAWGDEMPRHMVTIDNYWIGESEVTQAQWMAVMGYNPSINKGDDLPVDNVSWLDAQEFVKKLNEKTGYEFSLPTEAEWEYAARGGKNGRGNKYSGGNYVEDVAWCSYNSGGMTHAVKSKNPNELGLYDMSGNVWEWCSDWFGSYDREPQTNPTGAVDGTYKVYRGGSWYNSSRYSRVSTRINRLPSEKGSITGMRLAMHKNKK